MSTYVALLRGINVGGRRYGEISFDETEEIRRIATGIHLSHPDFINAKLQVTKA